MNRRDVLKAMGGMMAASSLVHAQQQPSNDEISLAELAKNIGPMMDGIPVQVAADALAPNFSLITGPGGNVAALVGPDGLVMVDCLVPGASNTVVATAKKLSGGAPITLINTHWHFDHTGGNAALATAGARIIAHKNTRERLATDQFMADFQMKIPASPAAALPTMTIGDSATLYYNGEEIHLVHVPPAHTDSDIFLHFTKANVLHTGDLFSNGFYPNIDTSSEGWIGGMIAATDLILKVANAKTKIIPGHGPMATIADMKATREMFVTAREAIEPLVEAGKTLPEVLAARPIAKLDARWGKGLFKSYQFTQLVYSGLVKHRGEGKPRA